MSHHTYISDIIRRFKLINNLADLELMEKRVDGVMGELNGMLRNVDRFVDAETDKMKQGVVDKVLNINPQREKKVIKEFIREFMGNVQNSFESESESRKNEILGG